MKTEVQSEFERDYSTYLANVPSELIREYPILRQKNGDNEFACLASFAILLSCLDKYVSRLMDSEEALIRFYTHIRRQVAYMHRDGEQILLGLEQYSTDALDYVKMNGGIIYVSDCLHVSDMAAFLNEVGRTSYYYFECLASYALGRSAANIANFVLFFARQANSRYDTYKIIFDKIRT